MNSQAEQISQVFEVITQVITRPWVQVEQELLPDTHRKRLNDLVDKSRIPALEAKLASLTQELKDLQTELTLQHFKEAQLLKELEATDRNRISSN